MEYPVLQQHSRHLLVALKDVLSAESISEVDNVFEVCLAHGGLEELDYLRPSGQTYNPRPARIALIVLREIGVAKPDVLKAALASACLGDVGDNSENLLSLPNHPWDVILTSAELSMAELSRLAPAELMSLYSRVLQRGDGQQEVCAADDAYIGCCDIHLDVATVQAAVFISLACWLDRARHLHLVGAADEVSAAVREELWIRFFEDSQSYLRLSEEYCPALVASCRQWQRRFELRLARTGKRM